MSELHDQRLVDEVMRQWPPTVAVFLRYKMRCIGCAIGRLHTIAEACREHDVDPRSFLTDLEIAILAPPRPSCPQPSAELPSPIISSL
ncbi:DUF1858 domain-containing protein [Tianweitania sediminis]|uniref:DUF1858 domain-containing protein n=1 Tax=Tianweitania sediminis TaxID=1502156 RepID=A0A8J7UGC7_9HYPH|nr:DUF1858 domain-containing protein [Tianweitania sediminis]MBP0438034.1 DUF1858 domain-containing protein [Tianweitania sediminis]